MQTSEQINELATALAKAQGEITGALKDSANPFYKSRYADLASCWDACRAALSKNLLAVMQTTVAGDGVLWLHTRLAHTSGQWVESETPILPKDDSPQAMGSALTYARRYALTAMVGIAQVDDDGNAASGKAVSSDGRPAGYGSGGGVIYDKTISLDDARREATAMRGILEEDVEERIKALKVLDRHDVLNKNADLYIAASAELASNEKSAWKKYIAQAKHAESEDKKVTNAGRRF